MKISIQFKNAEEFQQLLERAATLVEQLQETLQRINEFAPEIEVNSKIVKQSASNAKIDAEQFVNNLEKSLIDSMNHYCKYC